MNKVHFKDPLYYLYLTGTEVAYWFITQQAASSNSTLLQKIISTDSVDSLEFI